MHYKKSSLQFKFIGLIGSIITILALVIAALTYQKAGSYIKEAKIQVVEDKIESVNTQIQALTNETIRLVNMMSTLDVFDIDIPSEKEALLYKTFEDFAEVYSGIVNMVYFTDEQLYVYPRTDKYEGYKPVEENDWYQSMKAGSAEEIWESAYQDAITNKWITSYCKKIYDDSHNMIGILEVDVSLEHIMDTL